MFDVDLHCHSTASDGLLPPEGVVSRAAQNEVRLLSLTDHDDLSGLPIARASAEALNINFVNGVEISIEWGGIQVHILGYAFDEKNTVLNEGLLSIREGRVERAKRMSEALAHVGIMGSFEGAMRFAQNPKLISRAHFARYLVEIGVCKDVQSVFDAYIVPGKPGYVEHEWVSLAQAISWIKAAGGVASIAHPGRYKLSRTRLRQLFTEFKALGGEAIEVISGSCTADVVSYLTHVAQDEGFMASCGSDFHGPNESYVDLGRLDPLPRGLTPVWDAFH